MNKRIIGSAYEDVAADYLLKNGFEILDRNYRCRLGEIDMIAIKNHTIHFIEVKFRKNETYGNALYAVNQHKIKKLYHVAEFYILEKHLNSDIPFSFDVLAITGNQIKYLENCFGIM